jgi:hypothetical protein
MNYNHKNFVHLVGSYTYCRMMHGAYNVINLVTINGNFVQKSPENLIILTATNVHIYCRAINFTYIQIGFPIDINLATKLEQLCYSYSTAP